MKVSLDWLSDHIDLGGKTVSEIGEMLTFSGVEVEGIETLPDLVVVAEILKSEKHPEADRLSVCAVDDGTGEPRQIVCGAKNYAVGDKVPLALPGCQLGAEFKIKAGKLRGVKSDGMLCSAKELGMEDGADGLMLLDRGLKAGTALSEVFPAVFDLEVTPNRPDCLSHVGIARELAVLSGQALKVGGRGAGGEDVALRRSGDGVRISALAACPYYTARRIRGVKVGESPAWMQARLSAVGLRPINNVVDITNYVLLEMGQPLHAFDAAQLSGGIEVRMAAEGEAFLALDGKTYGLEAGDLVIADGEKAVAIAGVMGGEDTGVTEGTVDVLLESAYFAPAGIRRTSRRLGLGSDSSYRFERGVDPCQVEAASALAARLIVELAGGVADGEILVAGEVPDLVGEIVLEHGGVRQLMGAPVADGEIVRILEGLGLEKLGEEDGGGRTRWKVPSFRLDLQRPVDLMEEVARVYGLHRVEGRRMGHFADISAVDRSYDFGVGLARRLAGQGMYECRTIKLISAGQLGDHVFPRFGESVAVALKNPLTDDHTHMRPSVVPGLVAVAGRNVRMGAERLRFFEMGTVFGGGDAGGEMEMLGILISGPVEEANWQNPAPAACDLYQMLGVVESLDPGGRMTFEKVERAGMALAVEVYLGRGRGRVKIGAAGQLAPVRVRELGARHAIYVAEVEVGRLFEAAGGRSVRFEGLPRYPAVTRDVAMEVPLEMANGEVAQFFAAQDEGLLESYRLFDVYADAGGEKLGAGRKSLAYSLTYRSEFKTLEASEVDVVHGGILERLKKALPVSLR